MMAVLFQPTARCEMDAEVVEENPSEMGLHNRFMIYEVRPAWRHIKKNGSIKIGPKLPEKVQRNLNPASPFFLEEKS